MDILRSPITSTFYNPIGPACHGYIVWLGAFHDISPFARPPLHFAVAYQTALALCLHGLLVVVFLQTDFRLA